MSANSVLYPDIEQSALQFSFPVYNPLSAQSVVIGPLADGFSYTVSAVVANSAGFSSTGSSFSIGFAMCSHLCFLCFSLFVVF